MKYYLISSEYAGTDAEGESQIMRIETKPGVTNLGRKIKINGWLGMSDSMVKYAHGEFDSLEAARKEANEQGFTDKPADDTMTYLDPGSHIEELVKPEYNMYIVDIEEWLQDNTIANLIVTSKATDLDVKTIARELEESAKCMAIILTGTVKHLTKLRNKLI